MSKYNSTSVHHAALLIETNGRGEGAAFVALGGNLKRESVKTAIAVFDSLTRAPWWEEVGVGYEFRQGEPYRVELPSGVAIEHTITHIYTIHTNSQNTFFRDTRWHPPVKPHEVGDLIETEEQAESLPVGTIAVSMANEPIRKADMDEWRRVNEERGFLLADFEMAGQGDRITYLPSSGFNE